MGKLIYYLSYCGQLLALKVKEITLKVLRNGNCPRSQEKLIITHTNSLQGSSRRQN